MHLVARQAGASDFDTMFRLCRKNGESIEANRREWQALWRADSTVGVVMEDMTSPPESRIRALMVCAFLSDEFLAKCVADREPFVHAKIADDPSSLIPLSSFGTLNAGDGLNMLIAYMGWEGDEYHVSPAPNLRAVAVNSFMDRHGGNRLRWLFGEVGSPEMFDLTSRAGCEVLNEYAEWTAASTEDRRYHLMGISREAAMRQENQWIMRLFTYFPPRFHFTEPQRRILVLAKEGHTDAEIGAEIGVSSDAVKKRWGAIYERVAEVFPTLLPESPLGGRGAEKRRALLAHLRERPEELRPYDRRLANSASG